jgi:adenylate cyclase
MRRTLPLTLIISSAIVLLLVATASALLLISFKFWKSSVQSLAYGLMDRQAEAVQAKMERYFHPVFPTIRYVHEAIIREPEDLDDWESAGKRLLPLLDALPNMTWIYYTDVSDKEMIGAMRVPDGKQKYLYYRGPGHTTLSKTYSMNPDGTLKPDRIATLDESVVYDPTSRPWYRQAVAQPNPIWTDPYPFLNQEITGMSASWAHRDAEGKVIGVYAVDIVVTELAAFLQKLRMENTGGVFLLNDTGHPLFDLNPDEQKIFDRFQDELQNQSKDLGMLDKETRIDLIYGKLGNRMLSTVRALKGAGQPDCFVVTIVPGRTFFGVIRENVGLFLTAVILTLSACIWFGLKAARRIADPLTQVSREMARIAEFDISTDPVGSSRIHELAVVTGALDKMKSSLRAFSRYVPRDIVRSALADGQEAQVGGKVRELSILFADIAGFTTLSESLPPEEVFKELSDCLNILTSVPEKNGGAMLTFLGDGVLAVFNAPEKCHHHPAAAVHSALGIRLALSELNRRRATQYLPPFVVRMGVHTDKVLVGNVGIPDRFSYSVLGDGVNLTSRLEGLNKLYQTDVLCTESLKETTGDVFEWHYIDQITVKGRQTAVRIYTPLGLKGSVGPSIIESRKYYEEGIRLYNAREFAKAHNCFEAALTTGRPHGAARVMADRSLQYTVQSPPPEWDGSFVATWK